MENEKTAAFLLVPCSCPGSPRYLAVAPKEAVTSIVSEDCERRRASRRGVGPSVESLPASWDGDGVLEE